MRQVCSFYGRRRVETCIALCASPIAAGCRIVFIFFSDYTQDSPDDVSNRRLMRRSVHQLFANLGDPLYQSFGIGLLGEFDCAKEKEGGCDGASFRAFDLSSLEKTGGRISEISRKDAKRI